MQIGDIFVYNFRNGPLFCMLSKIDNNHAALIRLNQVQLTFCKLNAGDFWVDSVYVKDMNNISKEEWIEITSGYRFTKIDSSKIVFSV